MINMQSAHTNKSITIAINVSKVMVIIFIPLLVVYQTRLALVSAVPQTAVLLHKLQIAYMVGLKRVELLMSKDNCV